MHNELFYEKLDMDGQRMNEYEEDVTEWEDGMTMAEWMDSRPTRVASQTPEGWCGR
jgi:hypothetical protein